MFQCLRHGLMAAFVLGGLAVISACHTHLMQDEVAQSDSDIITYQCGDLLVQAQFYGDSVNLSVDDRSWPLSRVRVASGVKYQGVKAGDTIIFWTKGDAAWLSIDGMSYPACMRQGGD